SIDGGQTWAKPAGEWLTGLWISKLFIDPDTAEIYVGTEFGSAGWGDYCTTTDSNAPGQGLFRSLDGGQTWATLLVGTILDLEVDVTVSPRRLYVDDWATGVHRSVDG